MRILILLASVLIIPLLTNTDKTAVTNTYYYSYENILGTSFLLKVEAVSEKSALEAEAVSLSEIDRLEGILSTYNPDSEFNRWQTTINTDVKVSDELFEVMSLFDKWYSATGGVLNASVGAASELWENAAETNTLPSENELAGAVSLMAKDHWALNEDEQTARHLTNDPLLFNSFVKSYIIEKVSEKVMNTNGIASAVVNIGGDMLVSGQVTEKVGVAQPQDHADNMQPVSIVEVSGKAVATSGNYKRGYSVNGEWYSHIIDPRTAIPAGEVVSATVISDDAVEAGALATAFNILSPAESRRLADEVQGAEYLIVTGNGEKIESRGWKELESAPVPRPETIVSDAAKDFEMNIEFELARFAGRSLRPYVAVWIENDKAEPVRTLALWFNNYRWLPDLRRWYTKHSGRVQQYDFMQSITSATRSAGSYTLNWDLDDESGRQVKTGKYTVYIEASREHGTYQLIRKEIDLNNTAQRIDLEGGVEIPVATLDYRKAEKN